VVKNLWDIAALQPEDGDVKRKGWTEDENLNSVSSDASWSSSSAANSEDASCASPFNNSSKCSSSVASSDNGEGAVLVSTTDFTHDFYRLVKFESSRSLASSSSKSQHEPADASRRYSNNCDLLSTTRDDSCVDREQTLQSVLKFIAEQQCYCISRLVQDEQKTMAVESAESEGEHADNVTLQDVADGYFSKISYDNGAGLEDASYCTDAGANTLCDNDSQVATTSTLDYKTLFRTCDSCFQNIETGGGHEGENICDKCAHSYIECLPEEMSSPEYVDNATETRLVRWAGPSSSVIATKSCLDTVLEEQEETTTDGDSSSFVSLHDRATSKDVIEELNRMISKGEELTGPQERTTPVTDLDENCGCSTGWVHVEQDIDFNDPKVRKNAGFNVQVKC
jgi:hypothetical protein